MSNTITLDSIRQAADAKYGATVIDLGDKTVELVNPLRLSKQKREELTSIQESEELDVEEKLAAIIRVGAKTKSSADALLRAIDGDVAVLAQTVETYTTGTQAGEASPSEG